MEAGTCHMEPELGEPVASELYPEWLCLSFIQCAWVLEPTCPLHTGGQD